MKVTVTNRRWDSLRKPDPDDVVIDIGRPNPLGNPFQLGRGHGFGNLDEREKVIDQYRVHLERELERGSGPVFDAFQNIVSLVRSGKPVALNCWCAPLPCHGDVIAEQVKPALDNAAADQKKPVSL